MEYAQRGLITALLRHVFSLGLISNTVYTGAVDLVESADELPALFQDFRGERRRTDEPAPTPQ